MTDWQKNDLALCIRGGPWTAGALAPEFPKAGRVYLVERAGIDAFANGARPALWLVDGPQNFDGQRVWGQARFRKVTPPKADEFDREVIDLMTGKEVAMPSARAASPSDLSPCGSSCQHGITIAGERL